MVSEALIRHGDGSMPPRHVAIIMDGNGRWAEARGLSRTAGHRRGVEAVREAVEGAAELGIAHLTLFGFSSENWRRPSGEVSDLMGLLRLYLKKEIKALDKNGVRLSVIGERDRLAPDIQQLIADSEALTRANTRLGLTIALSYGGRQEIARAARELAHEVAAGRLDPAVIDEALLESRLWTAELPDPDLLIRTSGEQRISNFLLWQSAYAELVFVEALWPDFTRQHLAQAVAAFAQRERRFGGVAG
ncbi:isoprenyl transferase [Roseospirillum parvum]|uniref:Isoprenyl transferase n=1 Tax=Roseospirillum parvum TaxID=83401 RepID=A0A1G7Y272_9PROT|nr:isoprenyl transferase [Roseospirillum parvum]SDG90511.1 undecaprenyl diphosphate synthase [Roseospirillum parvum]